MAEEQRVMTEEEFKKSQEDLADYMVEQEAEREKNEEAIAEWNRNLVMTLDDDKLDDILYRLDHDTELTYEKVLREFDRRREGRAAVRAEESHAREARQLAIQEETLTAQNTFSNSTLWLTKVIMGAAVLQAIAALLALGVAVAAYNKTQNVVVTPNVVVKPNVAVQVVQPTPKPKGK